MIINLQHYKKHGYVKGGVLILRKMFLSLNQPVLKEKITVLGGENVYDHFPKFELEQETKKFKCTSCHICEDICPSKSIGVEGEKNSHSILTGNEPKSFWLNLSTCIQCNLCVDTCPVDALSVNGSYAQSYFEREGPLDLKVFEKEKQDKASK